MKELIQQARAKAKLTQEEVARRLYIAKRQYQNYEYGAPIPHDLAVRLGDILECPAIPLSLCRLQCPVGKKFSYVILNNVDISLMAILMKYRQEEAEAHGAIEHMAEIMLNKRGAEDCTPEELQELKKCMHEALDLEHVIEVLKLQAEPFLSIAELVKEHNRKCGERRYVDPQRPEILLAG